MQKLVANEENELKRKNPFRKKSDIKLFSSIFYELRCENF